MESTNKQISAKYLSMTIDEIIDLISEQLQKGKDWNVIKQSVLDYLNNCSINSREIYNWLLKNQKNSNSIFILGYFNYYGIETTKDRKEAFNLFINATKEDHILAQYCVGGCYEFGYGITKNEKLAFEYYEKLANEDYVIGQFKVGWFYKNGMGVKKDSKMAVDWYKKAANNGHLIAMHNLGLLYKNGNGNENRCCIIYILII